MGDMSYMFEGAQAFHRRLDRWDVSNVTTMREMFARSAAFDQDLGAWDITNLRKADLMLHNTKLSVANYDALLIGWASQGVQEDVLFRASLSKYSSAAAAARKTLVDTHGWSIDDSGQTP